MNRIFAVFICLLAGTLVVTATAQETGIPTPAVNVQEGHDTPAWKILAHRNLDERLIIVTVSQPGVKHDCYVESISDSAVFCKGKFGQTKAYQGDNIAALIRPGKHAHVWFWALGFLIASGGVALGAYFAASIALVAALPVALIAFVLFGMAGLSGMMADDDSPETVVYLRSETPLSVKLR